MSVSMTDLGQGVVSGEKSATVGPLTRPLSGQKVGGRQFNSTDPAFHHESVYSSFCIIHLISVSTVSVLRMDESAIWYCSWFRETYFDNAVLIG